MAHINLLPWREEAREQHKKDFIGLLVFSTLVAGGLLYTGMLFFDELLVEQKSRNDYLQKEISLLNGKIKEVGQLDKKREKMIAKMEVIQDLQDSRVKAVKILDALAHTVPNGIYLTRITREGDGLLLTGVAKANTRVSVFMRELDDNDVFLKSSLSVVAQEKSQKTFTLSVEANKSNGEEAE